MGVLRSSHIFFKLTKMVPRTMEEAYDEAQNFVNLEIKLKHVNKECSTTLVVVREKGKKELSLEKLRRLEYQVNKRFG